MNKMNVIFFISKFSFKYMPFRVLVSNSIFISVIIKISEGCVCGSTAIRRLHCFFQV